MENDDRSDIAGKPTGKERVKISLLLSPYQLDWNNRLLSGLQIKKDSSGIEFNEFEIDRYKIRRYFSNYPAQVNEALIWFNGVAFQVIYDNIKSRFTAQRAGIDFEEFYSSSMLRRIHELFLEIRPHADLLKWHQKLPQNDGHHKISVCTFSTVKPVLQFELIRKKKGIALNTLVVLNDLSDSLDQFARFGFLLKRRDEYFLLNYKDYKTLEWLQQNDPEQYKDAPEELARRVLSRLEEDYLVNRNNLLVKNQVNGSPISRVLLNEISGSFLMITPQWIYDGFLVEGAWKPTEEIIRQGETFVIHRDKDAETAFTQLLESLHGNFSKQLNGYFYLSFSDAQKGHWFLKVYHRLLELDIQLVGMDMLKHFRYAPFRAETESSILKEESNELLIRIKILFGKEEVPLGELQKILNAGQHAVMLKDGSLGILDEAWMGQYATIFTHGKVNQDEVRIPRWLAFSEPKRETERQLLRSSVKESWWKKWEQWQLGTEAAMPPPATFQGELRLYQQKGFEWMLLLAEVFAGGCLADDMGLGKTIQAICFLLHQHKKDITARHLIVCPSSLIYNWQKELQKFAPPLKILVYHGTGRDPEQLFQPGYQVAITSYGMVRSQIDLISTIPFGTVVLDESHHIKNPAALISRAVSRLQASFRFALSGTPVMNNTFDLYAQINFLLPGLLGTREFFKREYADAIDEQQDAGKIVRLKQLVAPFILRRTKEQVETQLPSKTEMIMWCDMGPRQREYYEKIKGNIRSSVFLNIREQGLGKSKLALLQGIMKLRQICNSPELVKDPEEDCRDSVKTDILMDELCNNLAGHKVLVFSQFTRMLDLLADKLTHQGIGFYHFDGKTPPSERMELVNSFQQEGNTVSLFLISLKAGNAGLNLTAADYVFLFDPWWNTAVQQQAIDRTHRIGQTRNVFAYKMICRDTIEEKIIDLQQRKMKLSKDLISEEKGFVKSLTQEDIAYLFS